MRKGTMNTITVVVSSCDAYEECWMPWDKLQRKYWPDARAVIITETARGLEPSPTAHGFMAAIVTVNNPTWTIRMREALKKISDEFIIFMCEDHFIRQEVDTERVMYALRQIKKNKKAAAFNFELTYRDVETTEIPEFGRQLPRQIYNHSCQPSLWRRTALIRELEKVDGTAQEWELTPDDGEFEYFINTGTDIINVGYRDGIWMGIRNGKWVQEDMVALDAKEQLNIDFSKRGFY